MQKHILHMRSARLLLMLVISAALLLSTNAALATVYSSRSRGTTVPRKTRTLNNRQTRQQVTMRPGRAVTFQGYHIRLIRLRDTQYARQKGSRIRPSAEFYIRHGRGGTRSTTLRQYQSYRVGAIWIEPQRFTSSSCRVVMWRAR